MKEFITQNPILFTVIVYVAVISILSIIITIYDKKIAGTGARRIPEKTLLVFSAIGGSVAMLLTMFAIRHKTQHKKFMIGIPLIMIVQAVLIYLICTML